MVEGILQSIPFDQYKRSAVFIRILFLFVIAIEFFKLHPHIGIQEIPLWILVPVFTLSTVHLISIAYEKSTLVTTEVEDRKCPVCKRQMYSKMIKCEICKIQIDTDDEK